MGFDVKDKRVTVAGAARSGLAAAELLARRGARVTLSEMRAELSEGERLRALGVTLELGGHLRETFTGADLIVCGEMKAFVKGFFTAYNNRSRM